MAWLLVIEQGRRCRPKYKLATRCFPWCMFGCACASYNVQIDHLTCPCILSCTMATHTQRKATFNKAKWEDHIKDIEPMLERTAKEVQRLVTSLQLTQRNETQDVVKQLVDQHSSWMAPLRNLAPEGWTNTNIWIPYLLLCLVNKINEAQPRMWEGILKLDWTWNDFSPQNARTHQWFVTSK